MSNSRWSPAPPTAREAAAPGAVPPPRPGRRRPRRPGAPAAHAPPPPRPATPRRAAGTLVGAGRLQTGRPLRLYAGKPSTAIPWRLSHVRGTMRHGRHFRRGTLRQPLCRVRLALSRASLGKRARTRIAALFVIIINADRYRWLLLVRAR